MKKVLYSIPLAFALLFCTSSFSQDEKHENHYQALSSIETDSYTLEFSGMHSQMAFTTMKMKVINKTNDYLFLDPSQIVFTYADGKTISPASKKRITIDPRDKKSKSIKVAEEGYNFHADNLTVSVKGFSLLPTEGTAQTDEVFNLPPKKNTFTIGEFGCNVKKNDQETKETKTQFVCTYKGNDVGLVDPSKISVKAEGDVEFANENKKSKLEMMQPGDDIKFTTIFRIPGKIVDMQFATRELAWNDAFIVSQPIKLDDAHDIELKLDEALTKEKNQ
jgi:hypothetical protein